MAGAEETGGGERGYATAEPRYVRCAGVTPAGELCRAPAVRGQRFCRWHVGQEPVLPGGGAEALPYDDPRRRPGRPPRRRTR